MRDNTVRRLSAAHKWVYRFTNGRIGGRLVNNDMLLLTTKGAVTGNSHTVPLLYLMSGDEFIVIASYGGRPNHPQWYHNLLAHPVAKIRVEEREFDASARTTSGAERSELWARVVAAYDGYIAYQQKTDREIPVVALSPMHSTASEDGV